MFIVKKYISGEDKGWVAEKIWDCWEGGLGAYGDIIYPQLENQILEFIF